VSPSVDSAFFYELPESNLCVLFQDFDMNAFWTPSLAVAVTSKHIAQKARVEWHHTFEPKTSNAKFVMIIYLASIQHPASSI
jgi:hypothetical protein